MIAILGAGGSIAGHLIPLLTAAQQPFRLVSRRAPAAPPGAESIAADLSDPAQALRAVAGCSAVFLLVGLQYDRRVWADVWPRIMTNTIEACKRAGARLVFFDNVYMYGRVSGPMTEETPFNPCSKKGEVRARIATSLIREWQSGSLTALIARAADFYGPATPTAFPTPMIFQPLSHGRKASWLVNDTVPHSFTYTPDAAQALLTLAESETAWNQTWHLPTAPQPPTGREFISIAAEALGTAPRHRVLSPLMIRLYGLARAVVGEIYEMLYQYDSPYLFDSSKYAAAFGFSGTPYAEGIRQTAATFAQ